MKKWQQGRTMIETLAVLAIGAILLVVGFAGYLMAMNRYRTNQILEYVNRCAVVAQSYGEGYEIKNEDGSDVILRCGDLLSDPAPNGLDGQEFMAIAAGDNTLLYHIVTPYIKSNDIRAALVARATTSLNGEIIDIWDFQGKVEFTFRK